jgi:signal transduction histidine kinase
LDLRLRFYSLSFLVVLGLTFVAGYLLWRDTRREVRVAELRSQFVSSVSHELKTPLTSIRMFAELLQMGGSSDPKMLEDYLGIIVNESERLTRLLNNVLDFSRIEHGQKSYNMEATRLDDVVKAVARTMEYPLADQGFKSASERRRPNPSGAGGPRRAQAGDPQSADERDEVLGTEP